MKKFLFLSLGLSICLLLLTSLVSYNSTSEPTANEFFARHMSESEANSSVSAKGLVKNLSPHQNKCKWIYKVNLPYRPSKQKSYTHKVTFEMKSGTDAWMRSNMIDAEDYYYTGETGHSTKVIFKSNENGARGVGTSLLNDFNSRVVKVTKSKL